MCNLDKCLKNNEVTRNFLPFLPLPSRELGKKDVDDSIEVLTFLPFFPPPHMLDNMPIP